MLSLILCLIFTLSNGYITTNYFRRLFYSHELNMMNDANVDNIAAHPVLVAPANLLVKNFLNNFAHAMRREINVIDSESIEYSDKKVNVVMYDGISDAQLDSLKKMNSIFIIDHSDDSTELKDSTQMIRQACKYDFYILIEESSMESSYNNVERLSWLYRSIETKLGEDSIRANTRIDAGLWSHFVSLTFKNVKDVLPNLHEIQKGADAFELRVDLLEDQSALSIHRQLAILRSQCPLPIVFTVRSIGQIGKYPEDPEKIFSLLREGLRGYAEWIDVEACWPENLTKAFVNEAINRYRSTSRLLGSLHVTTPQTSSQIQGLYDACDLYGFADIVKVVTGAENDEDCQRVHDVARALSKPYIGICLGAKGSLSRVLNKCFTPVCHPAMAAAAPGQLSAQELMKERVDRKLVSPLNFYLFGTPIKQSLSPGMHNAAFNQLLLPHHYHLQEEEDVDAYRELINLESFGGSSVTIPHKESIMPYLHEVRGAATSIGAVNTIVIEYENTTNESGENTMMRRKVGYNTDWLGIREPIIQRLQTRGNVWKKTGSIGLVNGAGGTAKAACYAVKDLGLELYVCNRNEEKGREVAAKFGGTFVKVNELSCLDSAKLQVIISTVPAQANFTVPTELLANKPVILDVVYKPASTKLIDQALEFDCPFVQGATMLFEQGVKQFELWNRRRAPRLIMEAAVFSGTERIVP